MSTTTIKAVWPGEKVEDIEELRNSHGSAPVIWNEIAVWYLDANPYSYIFRIDELWPLYTLANMPAHHRSVLLMTYDNAIVVADDFKQAALDIRAFLADFPPSEGYVNHWPRIAEIFDGEPDCPAIGFHMTSVSEDPFRGEFNEEIDDYDPPEWGKYWSVYELARKWGGK